LKSQIRTYIDADVIINALRVDEKRRYYIAFKVLEDKNRLLLVSDYLRLETLPKPIYHRLDTQVAFINKIFEHAELIRSNDFIIDKAMDLAGKYGLNGMDALHIASAISGRADEMVSFEKPDKPLYRLPITELRLVSLHPDYYH
jgi:predicted nucleic acid-binding protein